MSRLRVLSAGVDTIHLSARGQLKDGILLCFQHMQAAVKDGGSPMAFGFHDPEQLEFVLRGHGAHGHPFWLSSPRFEVFFGANATFPPAFIQLHSPWIHTVGVEAAVAEVEGILRSELFDGPVATTASRIDVYADEQGWSPTRDDFDRFACQAMRRRLYEVTGELHTAGRRLSGFVFGRGDVVGRIYDKTLEMQTRGHTWQELIWDGHDRENAVWRTEFQFRREALRTFRIRALEHALHARQALWQYGTTWLSLRRPTRHSVRARWPEAAVWGDLRKAWIGAPRCELIRERLRDAAEKRLVQGLVGYASSLEALDDRLDLTGVVMRDVPAARRYLTEKGEPFSEIVKRKRNSRLESRVVQGCRDRE